MSTCPKHTEIMETYNYALGLMSNEHWKKAQEVFEGLLRKEGFANMSVEKVIVIFINAFRLASDAYFYIILSTS